MRTRHFPETTFSYPKDLEVGIGELRADVVEEAVKAHVINSLRDGKLLTIAIDNATKMMDAVRPQRRGTSSLSARSSRRLVPPWTSTCGDSRTGPCSQMTVLHEWLSSQS